MSIPRLINPQTNPTGYIAAAGAVYAATVAIYNAVHHHGVLPTSVILAAIAAVGALFARQITTPVADPKDGNGNPLVAAPAAAAVAVPAAPPAGT